MSDAAKGRVESGAEVRAMNERAMDERKMNERGVDETLRMISQMPAPEGLEERVKAGLQLAETPRRVLAWPAERGAGSVWVRNGWARGAAAAAIALVVAGGGWGIYARVGPVESAKSGALPQTKPGGGFGEAGAMRRPLTLVRPTVNQSTPLTTTLKPAAPKAGQTAIHSQVSKSRPAAPSL